MILLSLGGKMTKEEKAIKAYKMVIDEMLPEIFKFHIDLVKERHKGDKFFLKILEHDKLCIDIYNKSIDNILMGNDKKAKEILDTMPDIYKSVTEEK